MLLFSPRKQPVATSIAPVPSAVLLVIRTVELLPVIKVPPLNKLSPVSFKLPLLTDSATVLLPDASASVMVPSNVARPEPKKFRRELAVTLLLPITWLATEPKGTLMSTTKPPTCWLKPARSSVPLLLLVPKVTVVPTGRALFAPSFKVPFWAAVPPL